MLVDLQKYAWKSTGRFVWPFVAGRRVRPFVRAEQLNGELALHWGLCLDPFPCPHAHVCFEVLGMVSGNQMSIYLQVEHRGVHLWKDHLGVPPIDGP